MTCLAGARRRRKPSEGGSTFPLFSLSAFAFQFLLSAFPIFALPGAAFPISDFHEATDKRVPEIEALICSQLEAQGGNGCNLTPRP
jgi:hypothetical protein